jgi:hypothetical protein
MGWVSEFQKNLIPDPPIGGIQGVKKHRIRGSGSATQVLGITIKYTFKSYF